MLRIEIRACQFAGSSFEVFLGITVNYSLLPFMIKECNEVVRGSLQLDLFSAVQGINSFSTEQFSIVQFEVEKFAQGALSLVFYHVNIQN